MTGYMILPKKAIEIRYLHRSFQFGERLSFLKQDNVEILRLKTTMIMKNVPRSRGGSWTSKDEYEKDLRYNS